MNLSFSKKLGSGLWLRSTLAASLKWGIETLHVQVPPYSQRKRLSTLNYQPETEKEMEDQERFSLEKVGAHMSSGNVMESNHDDSSRSKARARLAAQNGTETDDKDQSKMRNQSDPQKDKEFNPKSSPLEQSLRILLDRRRQQSTLRQLTLPRPSQIDFSSNDFLSLSTSPILKSAFIKELSSSQLPIGSGGSRLLDGNSRYAESLERDIAAFHNAPSGLLFNSGFDANAGFFSCVPQPGDVIVYDSLIHASVHDGMRLSRAAETLPFAHNSVSNLRTVLEKCLSESASLREGKSHVIVAVEAVYSMDGDLAPLREIVDVVEELLPKGAGYIVVDEAHSTGVLGPNGRGLVCELELESRIFARLHTFGKSLACNGGQCFLISLLHYPFALDEPRIVSSSVVPTRSSLQNHSSLLAISRF
jgi:7-keto-8-aminopelargonate synthetase-like enzyme